MVMVMAASTVAEVTAGTGIAGYIAAGTSAAIAAGRIRAIGTFDSNLRHPLPRNVRSKPRIKRGFFVRESANLNRLITNSSWLSSCSERLSANSRDRCFLAY